jgi:glutamate synthase domain-containing protein 3
MVVAERGAGEELRALLELHLRHYRLARSAALLEDWQRSSALFWRVLPREVRRAPSKTARFRSASA